MRQTSILQQPSRFAQRRRRPSVVHHPTTSSTSTSLPNQTNHQQHLLPQSYCHRLVIAEPIYFGDVALNSFNNNGAEQKIAPSILNAVAVRFADVGDFSFLEFAHLFKEVNRCDHPWFCSCNSFLIYTQFTFSQALLVQAQHCRRRRQTTRPTCSICCSPSSACASCAPSPAPLSTNASFR